MSFDRNEFQFERMIAWQKAKTFYHTIRSITQTFPKEERFDLVDQMNRASHSIVSNLAEGSGRTSNKDKARFYNMSYSSILEVASDIILAHDNKYINKKQVDELRADSLELVRIVRALIKSCC